MMEEEIDPEKEYNYSCFTKTKRCTKLMVAIMQGRKKEEIEKIILNYPDEIDKQNSSGCTALIIIAIDGHIIDSYEIVKLLLEYGANIDLQDKFERTALMWGIIYSPRYDNYDVIKLLIKAGANVNLTDCMGNTALMHATYADGETSEKIVRLLLEYEANTDLQNRRGSTALIIASCYGRSFGNEKKVKILLDNGATVDIKDNNGKTIMDYFANEERFRIHKLIIKVKYKKKIKELERKNLEFERKIEELEFRPGNIGYLDTKNHFDKLVAENKNEKK